MDRQGCGEGRDEVRSVIASTVGGIMTQEAGAVTGDIEVATRAELEGIKVLVRYAGADEWYVVEGGPVEPNSTSLRHPFRLWELHERILEHLKTPGQTVRGNEEPTSLLKFLEVAGTGTGTTRTGEGTGG